MRITQQTKLRLIHRSQDVLPSGIVHYKQCNCNLCHIGQPGQAGSVDSPSLGQLGRPRRLACVLAFLRLARENRDCERRSFHSANNGFSDLWVSGERCTNNRDRYDRTTWRFIWLGHPRSLARSRYSRGERRGATAALKGHHPLHEAAKYMPLNTILSNPPRVARTNLSRDALQAARTVPPQASLMTYHPHMADGTFARSGG